MPRLAINGYGRIGRCLLRALRERPDLDCLEIVAINEPADAETIAHLTRYDSTHGRFPGTVAVTAGRLQIDSRAIALSHHRDLQQLAWAESDIDLVLECSGLFDKPEQLQAHLAAGAGKVLLSQPGVSEIPALVWGVNHHTLNPGDALASAASCTTNGIAPVIATINALAGIESGVISTIHSVMNDQPVLDAYHHTDLRKTRSAGQSVIPVDTALAAGIDRILPALSGRFTARALRVPTHNVSAMELTVCLERAVSRAEANEALRAAAIGPLSGILGVSDEPLASCDFNHDSRSGIVDTGQTRVIGRQLSLLVWFDNEWAYANRMLDIARYWLSRDPGKT